MIQFPVLRHRLLAPVLLCFPFLFCALQVQGQGSFCPTSSSNVFSSGGCSNWECSVRIAVLDEEEGANPCRRTSTSGGTTPIDEEDFAELFGVVEDVPQAVETPSDYLSLVADEQKALVEEAADLLSGVCPDPCDRLGDVAEAVSLLHSYERFRLSSGTNELHHFLHADKDGQPTTADLLPTRAVDLTSAIAQGSTLLDQVGEDCEFLALSEYILEEAAKPIADGLFDPSASTDCPTGDGQPLGPVLEITPDGKVFEKRPYVPSQKEYAHRCAAKTAFMVQSSWSSNKGQIDQALELDKQHTAGDDERLKRELARDLNNAKQLEQGGYFYWMDAYLAQSYESLFGPRTGGSTPLYDALARQTDKWLKEKVLPHGKTRLSSSEQALLGKYYTYMTALSNPNLKVREDCKASTYEDYKKDYRPYIELRHPQDQPDQYTMRVPLTDLRDSRGRSLCDIGKQCLEESKTQLSQACDDLKSWTKDVATELLYARSAGTESTNDFSGSRNGVYSPGAIQSVSEYLYHLYTSSDEPLRAMSGLSIGDGHCPKDLAFHRTPSHLALTGGGYEQVFDFHHNALLERDELQVLGRYTGDHSQANFVVGLTTQDGGAELTELFVPKSEWLVDAAEPIKVTFRHGVEYSRINDHRNLPQWQQTMHAGAMAGLGAAETALAFLSKESFEGIAYHLPAAWDMQARATLSSAGNMIGMDNHPEHWEFLSHANMIQAKGKIPLLSSPIKAEAALSQFSDETIDWAYEEVLGRVEYMRAKDACGKKYPRHASDRGHKASYEHCLNSQLQAIRAQYPHSGGRVSLYAYLHDRFSTADYLAGQSMASDDNLAGAYYTLSAMGDQICQTSSGHLPVMLSIIGLRGGLSHIGKYGRTAAVRRAALAANVSMHIGGFALTGKNVLSSGINSYKNFIGGHQLSFVHSMSDFTLNSAFATSMSISALRVIRAGAKGQGTTTVPEADIYLHRGRTIVNDGRIRTPARQRIGRRVFRIRPEDVAGKTQKDMWTAAAKQAIDPEGGSGTVTAASRPITPSPGTRPLPNRGQGTPQRGTANQPPKNAPRVVVDERTVSPLQPTRPNEEGGLAIATPRTNTQTGRMIIDWEDVAIPEGLKPGIHTITVPCRPAPRLLPPMFASGDQDGSSGESSGGEPLTPRNLQGSGRNQPINVDLGGSLNGNDGGIGGGNTFTSNPRDPINSFKAAMAHRWKQYDEHFESFEAQLQKSVDYFVAEHKAGRMDLLSHYPREARNDGGFNEQLAMEIRLNEMTLDLIIAKTMVPLAKKIREDIGSLVNNHLHMEVFSSGHDWYIRVADGLGSTRDYHIHFPVEIVGDLASNGGHQALYARIISEWKKIEEYETQQDLFDKGQISEEPDYPEVSPGTRWLMEEEPVGLYVEWSDDDNKFKVSLDKNEFYEEFFNMGAHCMPRSGRFIMMSPEQASLMREEGVNSLKGETTVRWKLPTGAHGNIPVFLSSGDNLPIKISKDGPGHIAIQVPQGGAGLNFGDPIVSTRRPCQDDAYNNFVASVQSILGNYDRIHGTNPQLATIGFWQQLHQLRSRALANQDRYNLILRAQGDALYFTTPRGNSFMLPGASNNPAELNAALQSLNLQRHRRMNHLMIVRDKQEAVERVQKINQLIQDVVPQGENGLLGPSPVAWEPIRPGMYVVVIVDLHQLIRPVTTRADAGTLMINPGRRKAADIRGHILNVLTRLPITEVIKCPPPHGPRPIPPSNPSPNDGSSLSPRNDRGITIERSGRAGLASRGSLASRITRNDRNARIAGDGVRALAKDGEVSLSDQTLVRVVPTPTTNTAVIEGLYFFDDPRLTLLNGMGQAVQLPSWNALDGAIDLSALAPGLYRLVVVGQSGKTASVSVVKR